MKIAVNPDASGRKRLVATFSKNNKKVKTVPFGQANPTQGTYIDHGNERLKRNYIARHRVNEHWEKPMTAGALSRWLLWEKRTLDEALENFKRRFELGFGGGCPPHLIVNQILLDTMKSGYKEAKQVAIFYGYLQNALQDEKFSNTSFKS